MKTFLPLILLLFIACETVIDVEDPYPGSVLVLNGIIYPDSTVKVHISDSRSILKEDIWTFYEREGREKQFYTPIHGVKVNLYENDVLVASLTESGDRGIYASTYYPKPDRDYRIEASKEGYATASAVTKIPPVNAEIAGVSYDLINKNPYGNGYHKYEFLINLNIKDEPGENYYEIKSSNEEFHNWAYNYETEELFIWRSTEFYQINSDDVVFHPLGNSFRRMVFDDALFEGQRKVVSFSSSYFDQSLQDIKHVSDTVLQPVAYIQLRSLSYDYYAYWFSVALQLNSEKNPFSEPVQVYSNVENGYGIFAGYNAQISDHPIPIKEW